MAWGSVSTVNPIEIIPVLKLRHFEDAISIYNQLLDAPGISEAGGVLKRVVERVGFAAYAYMTTDGRTTNGVPVNVNSLKPELVTDYITGQFWARDPAVLYANHTTSPYFWRDSYTACEKGLLSVDEWRDVDDLARSHGYLDGIVLPVRTRATSFSITLFSSYSLSPEDVGREMFGLGLVGLAFDSWLRHEGVMGRPIPPPLTDKISRRERDVLGWLSEGKTSEEIGVILGLSPKTIDFHAANIISKLGVVNRVQAVAHAIRFGII